MDEAKLESNARKFEKESVCVLEIATPDRLLMENYGKSEFVWQA